MHCVISVGRRVRACTRLSEAAKALATRDHVRGISGPSTLPNTYITAALLHLSGRRSAPATPSNQKVSMIDEHRSCCAEQYISYRPWRPRLCLVGALAAQGFASSARALQLG
jgi:hypothetical protein